jgi:hypothetical protein
MPADPHAVQIDGNAVSWLMSAAGAFILFLLGLGIKDLRDRIKKVDQICVRLAVIEAELKSMRDREK